MTNRYRIVRDKYEGYEVQIRRPWLPIWFQCWDQGPTNTWATVEQAEKFARDHAKPVIKYLEEEKIKQE